MKRFATAAILALLALTVTTAPTSAGFGWCRADPLVIIEGRIVNIFVTGPLLAPLKVTGPNRVEITTPPNVKRHLILKTLGFGRGEIVTWKTSPSLKVTDQGIDVMVRVYVPARDSSMPVGVEFAPNVIGILFPVRAEGTANEWVTLKTVLR